MKYFILAILAAGLAFAVGAQTTKSCSKSCCAKKTDSKFSCKLTSPELQQRKETAIADWKARMIEKKELPNGYAYKFDASDATLENLNGFISDEKQCCDFLELKVNVSADKKESWLEISGPEGVKDFINQELTM